MGSKRLVYGVGINDADYVVQVNETIGYVDGKWKRRSVWVCPFYCKWVSMLQRGYSNKLKEKYPTYKDVTVTKDWHIFSNFKKWMEKQDWEGKQLDKDILFYGNKEYSADKCVFVCRKTNMFTVESDAIRGEFPIGVYWDKCKKRIKAKCRNGSGKHVYLGLHNTVESAFHAWLEKKRELSYIVAADESDPRVKEAIINRYKNYPIPDFSQYPTLEEMIARGE